MSREKMEDGGSCRMRLSLVMAGMYVFGRLGLFKPYLHVIGGILRLLDNACEEEWGIPWQESLPNMEAEIYV